MIGPVGIPELLIIFLIVLLFFGAKRLPEIGSSLGRGIREFKDSFREEEEEPKREISPGSREEEAEKGTRRNPPLPPS